MLYRRIFRNDDHQSRDDHLNRTSKLEANGIWIKSALISYDSQISMKNEYTDTVFVYAITPLYSLNTVDNLCINKISFTKGNRFCEFHI